MPASTRPVPDGSWFKSSYSGANATECVEVAVTQRTVLIRDSKFPARRHLAVPSAAWSGFLASLTQAGVTQAGVTQTSTTLGS
ncbi:DUF397 domain-containing protein [Streptomyces silvensis]|uniref:DUF397 domain-containing protein n=1 Tax=Streptomyces silvensis TaxID=1765722 RepID=A0A0W7X2W1_9ACTN|nr:DUF397 domain-containing protein [Streptomyces silvensis]KUF17182.1 hypothetical protein AT728_15130 [Streptomyces silvensis]